MGTDSFWRATLSRLPFVLIATVLAGITTLSVDTAPATALGAPVLVLITVSPTAVSVPAGETEQFTATGHYSDLSTKNLTDTVTWSTSSGSTATISNASGSQGLATAVGTGVATVTATDGSIFGTGTLTVLPAALLEITVSPAATSIPLGETAPFTAKGLYSDGSNANLTKSVTWGTSSSTVATVSNATGSQGDVTATGTGPATITATDPTTSIEGLSAVTVLPAALLTITVSPPVSQLPAGEASSFTASGLYSDGTTENITNSVTWSSSVTADATVSNTQGSQGDVTAVAPGASTITATDPTTSIFGTSLLTILPAVLVAIDVSPVATSIAAGDTQQYSALGIYSDDTTQSLTDSVTWSSSDTSTATVSNTAGSHGLVTAVADGATTITATDPTTSTFGVAALTVLPAVLVAVTVSPPAGNVPAGETEQFTATGLYSDGTTANITDSVTWASSDTSDATVSNHGSSRGLVTAVADGASTITATDPTTSIEGVAVVTVLPAVLVAVTVSPLASNVPAGETEQYTATGLYSDGTTADLTHSVTWASSDTSAATVSNAAGSRGLVTGVADGASTITATDPTTSIEGVAAVTVLPAVLVAIMVSPVEASVALHATEQFAATGIYSDASTQDLTDSVTWSSSDTSEAAISNTSGSQGLATGIATGGVTITATDPSSAIEGIAALDVTGPAITLTPSSGAVKTHIVVDGQGFTPGQTVSIRFKTGVVTAPKYTICTAVVDNDGTFSCKGRIRNAAQSGLPGLHKVNAKSPHVHGIIATAEFTLT